jgi:hypothetical protein
MEFGKLMRRGGIFVEVAVSILLFSVAYSPDGDAFLWCQMVAESWEETVKEQEYRNLVEKEILCIIREPSTTRPGLLCLMTR